MPEYYARLIPHLKGLHRVLALRKKHAGLYDGLFVRDGGKFLSGYDMAASKEIVPHVVSFPFGRPGGGAWHAGPFAAPCHVAEYTQGRQRCGARRALSPRRQRKKEPFISLLHHVDVPILRKELSLAEFGRMLTVRAGWGMRIAFVPEEFITES